MSSSRDPERPVRLNPILAPDAIGPLKMRVELERWSYREPLRIAGHSRELIELAVVTLSCDGRVGRGEAVGVRYRNESAASVAREIESVRYVVEQGLDHGELRTLLPPGGARNALDCALWDLRAKLKCRPVWELIGLPEPKALVTLFTCGAAEPESMARTARAYTQARALKLKLTGEPCDAERIRVVRAARPDVWLGIDANQGLTSTQLAALLPVLVDNRVELIEQPLPIGCEDLLAGLASPIPIAVDEGVQSLADLPRISGHFKMVNIKLDKCGGLTEALQMAHAVRAMGLDLMVGNMGGTSLGMAPAFLVGQLCNVVDLDGPMFLMKDRAVSVRYTDGAISCPPYLWGGG